MTLVERFIEFDRWPISRKTAVISGFLFCVHLVTNVVNELSYAVANPTFIDVSMLRWINWPIVGLLCIASMVGFAVDRRGREGKWTALLLVVPYMGFLLSLTYAFGSVSSPFIATLLVSGLIVVMIFGLHIGSVTVLVGFVLALVMTVAEFDPSVPYAPILFDRSIDAHRDDWYLSIGTFVILTTFVTALAILVLLVAAKQLQESRLERTTRMIRRYVPSQLADQIIEGEHLADAKPKRLKLTVFFSDIEGFIEASDHLDPEDLAGLLDEYLAEMMEIAERHGATINQIVGDGIMAFFGAPRATSDKDHALRAVRMALEMQRRMSELEDVWIERGIQKPFRIRIGINTGHASVGDYGSPGRKLYSAIGVQTNLAARIQACCDPGKVLISHSTWALVREEMACVDKGELQLKGVHYPVHVYELESAS